MSQEETQRQREKAREREAWMQQIIEDEQSKPLHLTRDVANAMKESQVREQEHLDSEVSRHISCLRKLRKDIVQRDQVKQRRQTYKDAQERMHAEKQALAARADGARARGLPRQGAR